MTNSDNSKKDFPVIIVCTDTSAASEVALRYACYKAKILGFGVNIFAVIENSHKNLLFGARAIGNEKRLQVEKHLKKLVDLVHSETDIIPSISIREGEIASEIIREVKNNENCMMVVFGKSYNSMSDNAVLPKIAQKIGSKIKVPITIVPENLTKEYLKKLI